MTELTIQSITARPVIAPLALPVVTASGSIHEAPLVLIDVATREGPVGRAYLFTYLPALLKPVVAALGELAAAVKGQPLIPDARMAQMEAMFRLAGKQGVVGMAISGLDMAFWDAVGRASGLPVAGMLGGAVVPIPCYDSYGMLQPGRDDAVLAASVEAGFGAIKVKCGWPTLADDLEALRAFREVIGPDVALMIDFNQSLSAPEAIRRVLAFEDAGLDLSWVEEPVAAEDFAGHRTVRQAISTPVQTGENWWFPEDAARALAAGICDHAMPDLMKIGGITGWQRASAMCAAASVPVSSHIFPEASAHVLAVTKGAHLLEFLDLAGAVLAEPARPQDGRLAALGPGLGMNWDEAAVARFAA